MVKEVMFGKNVLEIVIEDGTCTMSVGVPGFKDKLLVFHRVSISNDYIDYIIEQTVSASYVYLSIKNKHYVHVEVTSSEQRTIVTSQTSTDKGERIVNRFAVYADNILHITTVTCDAGTVPTISTECIKPEK